MKDLPANCLFGFFSAEMASFKSASILAFFCALRSSAPALETLLESVFRDLSFRDLSPCGMRSRPSDSLASRFRPGMAAGVADLILASTSTGLRDAFHFCWSLSKTLSSDLEARTGAGRLAAAPGLAVALAAVGAMGFFGLGGDAAIGPPSFLLRSAHKSGSRPEKLRWLTHTFELIVSKSTYNGTMMSIQKSFSGSELALSDFCGPWPLFACASAAIIIISSKVVDCQMLIRSACKWTKSG